MQKSIMLAFYNRNSASNPIQSQSKFSKLNEEYEFINSPLSQLYSDQGHTLQIHIYRGRDEPWVLEVEDAAGTSLIWDDQFESDQVALDAALSAIKAEGVVGLMNNPEHTTPTVIPGLFDSPEQTKKASPAYGVPNTLGSLNEAELHELEHMLLYDVSSDEGMNLEILDGYLHALAIGPETVNPSRWLPVVWGRKAGAIMPPIQSIEVANYLVSLIMRHYNSIVSNFEEQLPIFAPCWEVRTSDLGEFEDAENWSYGFTEAVKLTKNAWQVLLNDVHGRQWYRPIGLLGADDFSDDQNELTLTPALRQDLTRTIESNLMHIHAFWLPHRLAVAQRQYAQAVSTKVGRNELCRCGSAQKFKKCCGSPNATTIL